MGNGWRNEYGGKQREHYCCAFFAPSSANCRRLHAQRRIRRVPASRVRNRQATFGRPKRTSHAVEAMGSKRYGNCGRNPPFGDALTNRDGAWA
jgi:hypothetical protein